MRCFIAVDIPEELKAKIINLQKHLRNLDVKLVEKENLHFTLKFLGEADENTIAMVKERLLDVAKSTSHFTINISGIGVFPNENYIRVVWLGCKSEDFIKLHQSVDESLVGLFKKERPSPHLTIARVRSPKNRKEILDFISNNRNINIGSMTINEIKLKKSTLTRNGPIYEAIEVFDLA